MLGKHPTSELYLLPRLAGHRSSMCPVWTLSVCEAVAMATTHAPKETQQDPRRVPVTHNRDQQNQRPTWVFKYRSLGHLVTPGHIWLHRHGSFEAACYMLPRVGRNAGQQAHSCPLQIETVT